MPMGFSQGELSGNVGGIWRR